MTAVNWSTCSETSTLNVPDGIHVKRCCSIGSPESRMSKNAISDKTNDANTAGAAIQ
jgi:hypothetical protein